MVSNCLGPKDETTWHPCGFEKICRFARRGPVASPIRLFAQIPYGYEIYGLWARNWTFRQVPRAVDTPEADALESRTSTPWQRTPASRQTWKITRDAQLAWPGRNVPQRLLPGLIIVTLTSSLGCIQDTGTIVATPDFTGAAARVNSPVASRMRSRQAAEREQAGRFQLVSLPEGIEPAAEARAWHYIVLHHTASPSGDVASIDALHREQTDRNGKPWLGIGYHFVIGNGRGMRDGEIEATFRWREQLHGAHAGSAPHNAAGIGICLVGDFEQEAPTERQLAACIDLVRMLAERYEIDQSAIVRHRDVKATACPGRHFPWEEFLAAVELPPRDASSSQHQGDLLR